MIRLKNIVNIFFASIVIGSGIGYGKLYLFHVLLVLLLILRVSSAGLNFKFPKRNIQLFRFLLFTFLWYFLSISWSLEPLYSVTYLFYIFLGIAIVFASISYLNSEEQYHKIFNAIKWAFLIELVIALLEITTTFRLPTSPYSEYAYLFNRKATDFNLFDSDVSQFIKTAPTAFMGNPNNLGVVIVSILPFFLFLKNVKARILGVSTILIVVLYTGSRGAFIALICCVTLYMLLKFKRGTVLLVVVLAVTFYSVLIANIEALKKSDNKRISELAYTGDALNDLIFSNDDTGGSISLRQNLIKNGMTALWKTNGLGVGGGASVAVQEQAGGATAELGSMHNFWIEILVEGGVLYWISFVIWYLTLALKTYRIYKKSKVEFYKYQAGSLFVSLATFSIACISASSVIYLLPMWLLFGMSISLIILYEKHERKEQTKHYNLKIQET